ncbi:MarR family winged helix-turn-helix transcriptional regulator [Microbacterium sp. MYb66]|jgi:DNA-binding MarR family transcriptional regulator|uniref:MarR family winged helix-turn-helix transcriptional regulator n=1 Tax=Microbacterium sp. MYb66 TaxID=1848692 RepID=UPI000D004D8E|nr:MarR family transcriptional regulator [Microbacterium sp. MYb66]PRA79744.1 MarR family transcriptional regulator [Microbacterium sp. MYb66]
MDRLEGRATWWVSRAHLRAHALLQELFADAGARAYHYRLLAAVEEAGPISQADLGRAAELDRSDVSVALVALEASGFVTRAPHPSDRRRILVALTAPGRAELARLDAVVDHAQERFLAPLAEEERAGFLDMVRRLGSGADPA